MRQQLLTARQDSVPRIRGGTPAAITFRANVLPMLFAGGSQAATMPSTPQKASTRSLSSRGERCTGTEAAAEIVTAAAAVLLRQSRICHSVGT